jgi:prefoldin subunit 5
VELQMSDENLIREIATHGAEIKHIQDDLDQIAAEMKQVRQSLDAINRTLSEAQGGWKLLMWIGGAASAITGIVGFVVGHWGK